MIAGWVIWLCITSTWALPGKLSIPCTAIVLVFGALNWSFAEAAIYFFIMGFLFHAFSITPAAFYWVALFLVFFLTKIITYRLSIDNLVHMAIGVFLSALGLDFVQWFLLRSLVEIPVFRWATLGGIILSAIVQALISIIFARPLMSLVARK